MLPSNRKYSKIKFFVLKIFLSAIVASQSFATSKEKWDNAGNFSLPGLIDIPTANRLPDGELVFSQQIHSSLARTAASFQILPSIGVSFKYSGHGVGGSEAYSRINHDRSFDVHFTLLDQSNYVPSISIGLRDFIGTGWYSSEYIVATKSFNDLELTLGIGYGRLAERQTFKNPLSFFSSKFSDRNSNSFGSGGTLGTINWFQGDAASFGGLKYKIGQDLSLLAEFTNDTMSREAGYLQVDSPWNFAINYKLNKSASLSAQYLHGSVLSLSANLYVNPNRPPLGPGRELAPVPMRARNNAQQAINKTDIDTINKVLSFDGFKVIKLEEFDKRVRIDVENTKFRSTSQALGRITSTLQRFTKDKVKFADIVLHKKGLQAASYRINLELATIQQVGTQISLGAKGNKNLIVPFEAKKLDSLVKKNRFTWGFGPYFEHRLFNPDLPLSLETGIQLAFNYNVTKSLKLGGTLRKSVFTNLTDNKRRSDSVLPRVHSDWPLYDLEGQAGHVYDLKISNSTKLLPNIYTKVHAGLLEPKFAGYGGEILFKPSNSSFAFGLDIHQVKQREYDMRFKFRDYSTTIGHISAYYDAGRLFDWELNLGRYLAKDWGATLNVSRRFGNGWVVGGYATLTDVPFATFGEGSFDKGIYASIPIDWIIGAPSMTRRRLSIRPITRDGGAQLHGARSLYGQIRSLHNAQVKRELGRLWK